VNLLSNAIKFTAVGEVVLQMKVLSSPRSTSEPWHLHFSVRDTGIGIPVDRLARLFKSFSQADASTTRHYGGTGLGLAISKRLVEMMGGKMWVESVPQKGSTFHFTLPMQGAPNTAPALSEAPEPVLSGLRLLIVDDNLTNCRILSVQSSKWGMAPRVTQKPAQALEWARSGERFDLAILDMQMPEMDGLMLATELRKLPGGVSLPLVLLASMGMHPDQSTLATSPFVSCLTKPLKPVQLREALIRVVSGTKTAVTSPAPAARLDPGLAQRLPLRVLLCDDNLVNQKVALRLLQQMGYQADLAANGIEALAALARRPYDIVFMDVMMPEMGGLEATRIIRERQLQPEHFPSYKSPIIVVAMTANAMQGDREKCLSAGMDDYLAKPVRLEDVRAIIERWAPIAAMTEPVGVQGSTPSSTVSQNGPLAAATQTAELAPVDMGRLHEFTDGNPESLRELATLYLNQTTEQLEQLDAAVASGVASEVRRLAHSCAGASATCGMRRIAPILRELEGKGLTGDLSNAAQLCAQANAEFERIRTFLSDCLTRGSAALASKV
jgi:CheY-like chemotaxis protein/HPt (histidine-containing phosphotransfer) domain-containing protein